MLFKVEHGKSTFELNPGLKAIPEFINLTDRQMDYVILSTDYRSPFRKLAPEDKRTQAAAAAGYKYEKDGKRLDMNGRNITAGKVAVVEAAIKRYRELQRDDDYETLLSVSSLIAQIRELNNQRDKSAAELEKAVKMTKELVNLTNIKKELEDVLDQREDPRPDPTFELSEGELTSEAAGALSVLARINMGE